MRVMNFKVTRAMKVSVLKMTRDGWEDNHIYYIMNQVLNIPFDKLKAIKKIIIDRTKHGIY